MIVKFYEVRCDYCGKVINHYPLKKPSRNVLDGDGVICSATKNFCSIDCYGLYLQNRREKQYMNLKQNGVIHNNN